MEPDSSLDHDPAALAMIRRIGGDALLSEMVALFTQQSRERLAAARTAERAEDADAVRRAFHSLKSSTAQLGANTAAQLCADGEALARSGDIAAVKAVLDQLEPAIDRALHWLDAAGHTDSAA